MVLTNSLGMEFIKVPGRDYYMGKYTVTQKEWKAVMGTTPWKVKIRMGSQVKEGDDYPATCISWNDCQEFIEKLNQKEDVDKYRLPTEEEWEYASRAGSTTKYCFGDDAKRLGDYAWFDENTGEVGEPYPHEVGQRKPNKWGLYDMHGNFWEWCEDLYDRHKDLRTARGGCWRSPGDLCASSYRIRGRPGYRYNSLGVRLVIEISKSPQGSPSFEALIKNTEGSM